MKGQQLNGAQKAKEAISEVSGSVLKCVMPSTLPRLYENCVECKLAHLKHAYKKQHKIQMTKG